MATASNSPSTLPPQPLPDVEPPPAELSPWQKLSERIRGTVIIHGDIVSRDPELWDCERE